MEGIMEKKEETSHRRIEFGTERMICLAHKTVLKQRDLILLLFQHSGQH